MEPATFITWVHDLRVQVAQLDLVVIGKVRIQLVLESVVSAQVFANLNPNHHAMLTQQVLALPMANVATKTCWQWMNDGRCKYGDKCRLTHTS